MASLLIKAHSGCRVPGALRERTTLNRQQHAPEF